MDDFKLVNKEYQKVRIEISEVLDEVSKATDEVTDYSKLTDIQTRLREVNRKLDTQSENIKGARAKGVMEESVLISKYSPYVNEIKENRLHIARSMNEIETYIDLEFQKHEKVSVKKKDRYCLIEFPKFWGDKLLYLKWSNEFQFCIEFVCDMTKDLFSMEKPKDESYEIKHYWYTAVNKLKDMLSMGMHTENLLMHYIICSLPMPFRGDFILQLPLPFRGGFADMKPKEKTKLLSIDEANETFVQAIDTVRSVNIKRNKNVLCKQASGLVDQNGANEAKDDLPLLEFHGDILAYKSFKESFFGNGVIESMSKKDRLYHLKQCLKDDAQRYIGSQGAHHKSYENMWKYLDKRYDDLWTIANEKVKYFFNMQQPKNEQFEILKYWNTLISELRSILDLELNLENIFSIYIIQTLPMKFQFELTNKLKCKELGKKLYRLDEIQNSLNDLIPFYITKNLTSSNLSGKGRGYEGNRKSNGSYRGSGRGRACKRYD